MKPDHVAWAAVVVALVGLLWTVNTGFDSVHERIDRLNEQVNGRFEQVNERFDRMQAAIAALDDRVSRIEGRFDTQSALTPEAAPAR